MGACGTKACTAREADGRTPVQRLTSEASNESKRKSSKLNIILGKYSMSTVMGQGSSSVCYKGTVIETGKEIAIKTFKDTNCPYRLLLKKFKRQIEVLKDLSEPFSKPSDPSLWCEELARRNPADMFLELIDFSKNEKGEPGLGRLDRQMYLVTELAHYSLKQLLADRRDTGERFTADAIHSLSKELIITVAGLHAKGYVHLDLKPENLMICGDRMKLIDVDGCVKAGTVCNIGDETISYSPIYCAPEWARFVVEDSQSTIVASPELDVWSVGATICELVKGEGIMKDQFRRLSQERHAFRNKSWVFLDWLSRCTSVPLPSVVKAFDAEFHDLVHGYMLVCKPAERKTLAQCLSSAYMNGGQLDYIKRSTSYNKDNWKPDTINEEPLYQEELPKSHRNLQRRKHRTLSRRLCLKTLWPDKTIVEFVV